ncbi:MAG: hypothetical protein IPL23_18035 [Saprospiraceae bacterium]|nr:hypothetical protein [Saprospiraceae bacterium]
MLLIGHFKSDEAHFELVTTVTTVRDLSKNSLSLNGLLSKAKHGISNFYANKIEESKFEKLILVFSVKETT